MKHKLYCSSTDGTTILANLEDYPEMTFIMSDLIEDLQMIRAFLKNEEAQFDLILDTDNIKLPTIH